MLNRVLRTEMVCVLIAVIATAAGGCGSRGAAGVPDSVTVQLPDGTEVQATLGAGVPSLADSEWRFFRTAGTAQSIPFVTIAFGAEGNLAAFENNTIATEVFGATIVFDGDRHDTSQPGVEYAAATYGAETSDATGFAFEGRLTAFAGPLQVATATASASGTFDPDDPDTMTGTFAFSTRVSLSAIPEGDLDEEFTFIAHRVVEDQ